MIKTDRPMQHASSQKNQPSRRTRDHPLDHKLETGISATVPSSNSTNIKLCINRYLRCTARPLIQQHRVSFQPTSQAPCHLHLLVSNAGKLVHHVIIQLLVTLCDDLLAFIRNLQRSQLSVSDDRQILSTYLELHGTQLVLDIRSHLPDLCP